MRESSNTHLLQLSILVIQILLRIQPHQLSKKWRSNTGCTVAHTMLLGVICISSDILVCILIDSEIIKEIWNYFNLKPVFQLLFKKKNVPIAELKRHSAQIFPKYLFLQNTKKKVFLNFDPKDSELNLGLETLPFKSVIKSNFCVHHGKLKKLKDVKLYKFNRQR